MSLQSALAFALAMTLYSLAPGPAIAATLARATQSGMRPAMIFLAGLIIGDALYLLAALAGLASLALSLGPILTYLRIASGLYLVYLAISTWLQSPSSSSPSTSPSSSLPSSPSSTLAREFAVGLAITCGNPKTVLFYLGIMPSILDLERITLLDTAIALAILLIVSYATFAPLCYLAARARLNSAARPRLARTIQKSTAFLLAATGLYLAIDPFFAP